MIYTVHGWGFDSSVWDLAGLKGAVHLELPGHGSSKLSQTDILKLSDELSRAIEPDSTVIGWSLGATLACLIAARLKVRKLILVAPTVRFSGISQPEVVVRKFLRDLKRDFASTVERFRKLCFKERVDEPPLPEREKAIELLESFASFDLLPHLRRVKAETVIVVGEDDAITGLMGAFGVFRGVGKATLIVERGGDHFPLMALGGLLP